MKSESASAAGPRPWSSDCTTAEDCTFQQLAPYIGRMKTSIARSLIGKFTLPGQVLLDPFAGSGVIPFEAAILGRTVVACDTNPYGALLMRAKFSAPASCEEALEQFNRRWAAAQRRLASQDLRRVPAWVRTFFHHETLRSALALRDELVAAGDDFLMACLLGILHHQRPGFLSYPSSHLVPYLRNKLFPRHRFGSMYEQRDVRSRMESKIRRTFRRPPSALAPSTILRADARRVPVPESIDAIITSPPYMNELDYVRDNRLRLWFIQRKLPAVVDIPRGKREEMFRLLLTRTFQRFLPAVSSNAAIVIVVGDTRRGGRRTDAAKLVKQVFATEEFDRLRLESEFRDRIPDVRRSRRDLAGTKRETVLVFRSHLQTDHDAKAAS